jgi:hypothetical protein
MNQQADQSMRWRGRSRLAAAAAMLCLTFAQEAGAACVAKDLTPAPSRTRPTVQASPALSIVSTESHGSIVGFWNVTFLLGDGPAVYDQGFQQWHVDNTELMVDNAVPPSLGNVCVGVWKQVGARTYKLKHMTFNWDTDGRPTGTFVLTLTATLDRRGNVYTGRYEADSFDLEGKVIPELHAEGAVRGTRTVVN